jgi:translin
MPAASGGRRDELSGLIEPVRRTLDDAHAAREDGLAAARRVIRTSGSAIRTVHRLDIDRARELIAEAGAALGAAQAVLEPFPAVSNAGFLHDAAKEYVEARITLAVVVGEPLPGPGELGVENTAWLRGTAEAASELRRHLLDRLRAGDLQQGEEMLQVMDDIYDVLVGIDYPDALTNGLRRTLDALRAVLERTRGDVTTTVLQMRLQTALERRAGEV